MAQRGTSNTLKKLAKSVADGDHYEAQQMYKTLYHRYLARKNYKKTEELLLSALETMGTYNQGECAFELGELLLEYLEKASPEIDTQILLIIKAMRTYPKNSTHGIRFSKNALVQLAKKIGKTDDPVLLPLHTELASLAESLGVWGTSLLHFANARDATACGRVVRASWKNAPAEEIPLFITRAVLFMLVVTDEELANTLFEDLAGDCPESVTAVPLMAFTRVMIGATAKLDANSRNAQVFEDIIESFDDLGIFGVDTAFEDLLTIIGQRYFNFMPASGAKPNLMTMMMDLLGNMGGPPDGADAPAQ